MPVLYYASTSAGLPVSHPIVLDELHRADGRLADDPCRDLQVAGGAPKLDDRRAVG